MKILTFQEKLCSYEKNFVFMISLILVHSLRFYGIICSSVNTVYPEKWFDLGMNNCINKRISVFRKIIVFVNELCFMEWNSGSSTKNVTVPRYHIIVKGEREPSFLWNLLYFVGILLVFIHYPCIKGNGRFLWGKNVKISRYVTCLFSGE